MRNGVQSEKCCHSKLTHGPYGTGRLCRRLGSTNAYTEKCASEPKKNAEQKGTANKTVLLYIFMVFNVHL